MSIKVKICATRSIEAAQVAVAEGAEFLGLVITPKVKTHTVNIELAKSICKKVKGKINLVGVFQNMLLDEVKKIIADCNLDYAQFHGDESPQYLSKIAIKKIKAFRFPGEFDIDEAQKKMRQFKVDYYLLDRIKQSQGPMLNLHTVSRLTDQFPIIFAGGLNADNVAEIIKKVKPQIVDVASGVETNGKQDLEKIRAFIKNAQGNI